MPAEVQWLFIMLMYWAAIPVPLLLALLNWKSPRRWSLIIGGATSLWSYVAGNYLLDLDITARKAGLPVSIGTALGPTVLLIGLVGVYAALRDRRHQTAP